MAYMARPNIMMSVRSVVWACMMRYPRPLWALISSATMTISQLPTSASRRPMRKLGNAPGRMIFRTSPQRSRPKVSPASTNLVSTPRMPANVLM